MTEGVFWGISKVNWFLTFLKLDTKLVLYLDTLKPGILAYYGRDSARGVAADLFGFLNFERRQAQQSRKRDMWYFFLFRDTKRKSPPY